MELKGQLALIGFSLSPLQYSAYIMDERFPVLPMLKWDHMMQAPPIFAQVLPGHASSSVGGSSSTKVVIGSQSSQEIVMLQYSGH